MAPVKLAHSREGSVANWFGIRCASTNDLKLRCSLKIAPSKFKNILIVDVLPLSVIKSKLAALLLY